MRVFHLGKAYICSAKFSPEILNFPVRAYSITFENKKLSLHHLYAGLNYKEKWSV